MVSLATSMLRTWPFTMSSENTVFFPSRAYAVPPDKIMIRHIHANRSSGLATLTFKLASSSRVFAFGTRAVLFTVPHPRS